MKSQKISEKHRVILNKPYQWEYNNNVTGVFKTSKFLNAVKDIDGVIDIEYDFEADTSFFVTIDENYCWLNVVELIRTLAGE